MNSVQDNKYLERQICKEYNQGTSIEDIAKLTDKSIWFIKSALKLNWFTLLESDTDEKIKKARKRHLDLVLIRDAEESLGNLVDEIEDIINQFDDTVPEVKEILENLYDVNSILDQARDINRYLEDVQKEGEKEC